MTEIRYRRYIAQRCPTRKNICRSRRGVTIGTRGIRVYLKARVRVARTRSRSPRTSARPLNVRKIPGSGHGNRFRDFYGVIRGLPEKGEVISLRSGQRSGALPFATRKPAGQPGIWSSEIKKCEKTYLTSSPRPPWHTGGTRGQTVRVMLMREGPFGPRVLLFHSLRSLSLFLRRVVLLPLLLTLRPRSVTAR